MLANLYRGREFRQLWTRDYILVTHTGTVGTRGAVTKQPFPSSEALQRAFEQAVSEAEREGFFPREPDPYLQVLVTFNVATWEVSEILSFEQTLFSILGNCLGWIGNGYCDGHTIGRGSLTMWCPVIDIDLAIPVIIAELERSRLLYDEESGCARISVPEGAGFRLVFPETRESQ